MKICIYCKNTIESTNWYCGKCCSEPPMESSVRLLAPELDASMGFSDDFFPLLERVENNHFWFQSRNILIKFLLQKFHSKCEKFLEIGCGTGFVLDAIRKASPGAFITASEISVQGIKFAVDRGVADEYIQMDARNIPYISEFDCIGLFDVLEHIENDSFIIAEIHRALATNGTLIISVPQHKWLWSNIDVKSWHFRRYQRNELKNILQNNGFSVIWWSSFNLTLAPLLFFQSRMKWRNQSGNVVEEHLYISYFSNKIALIILFVEQILITLGLKLPFGTSIFMVARKINEHTF